MEQNFPEPISLHYNRIKKLDMKNSGIKLRSISGKRIVLFFFLLIPSLLYAAEGTPAGQGDSIFIQPLFLFLGAMVLIFLVFIITLGKMLTRLSDYYSRNKDKMMRAITLLFVFFTAFHPAGSNCRAAGIFPLPESYSGVPAGVVYLLLLVLLLETVIIFTLFSIFNRFLYKKAVTGQASGLVKKPRGVWQRIFGGAPVETDEEKMTDHVYDGIRELDNGMPPWLQYMFLVTVIFAVFYLLNYHVWKSSPLQLAEYNKELSDAKAQLLEFQKKSANLVDESNVVRLTDAAALKEGMVIFNTNCTACHGLNGEGTVGPNLTDQFWIHGGAMRDIFKTIKYGVVEKGMKSWQSDLSPRQMQLVASYIKTLAGTNPPNAKEKQGDFYNENASQAKDTAAPGAIKPPADSLLTAGKN